MVKVFLYGKLEKLFGKEWNLNVRSLSEAIRAININTKRKFEGYLAGDGLGDEFVIKINNNYMGSVTEAAQPLGKNPEIHILPAINFSGKKGGILLIIAAVVLIAIGQWGPGMTVTTSTGATAASTLGSTVTMIGVSLLLSGIGLLLTPTPKSTNSGETKDSNFFSGDQRVVTQGSAVPVGYGRIGVRPTPLVYSVANDNIRVAYGKPEAGGKVSVPYVQYNW